MYSALSSIGKNLILVGVVILSAVNFVLNALGRPDLIITWQHLLIIQCLAGLAYIFLSCYEFLNAQYLSSLPVKRFSYFTNRYVMFKTLKIIIFLAFGGLLYLSGTNVKYISPICVTIALTEGIVMLLKYKKDICFVSISLYANYIMFSQDKTTKLFASQITLVEFRHDIFYFVKKDKKTMQIKLVHIEEKEVFLNAMNAWLKRNKINVGLESQEKLSNTLAPDA